LVPKCRLPGPPRGVTREACVRWCSHQVCPPWGPPSAVGDHHLSNKEVVMAVMIGIDPHKRSHTAVALNGTEEVLGQLRLTADRRQLDRLLRFAAPWPERVWAVENANGLGRLLARQLLAAGETVVDVPAKLSARVRALSVPGTRPTPMSRGRLRSPDATASASTRWLTMTRCLCWSTSCSSVAGSWCRRGKGRCVASTSN